MLFPHYPSRLNHEHLPTRKFAGTDTLSVDGYIMPITTLSSNRRPLCQCSYTTVAKEEAFTRYTYR
jgi:hypothetical protein